MSASRVTAALRGARAPSSRASIRDLEAGRTPAYQVPLRRDAGLTYNYPGFGMDPEALGPNGLPLGAGVPGGGTNPAAGGAGDPGAGGGIGGIFAGDGGGGDGGWMNPATLGVPGIPGAAAGAGGGAGTGGKPAEGQRETTQAQQAAQSRMASNVAGMIAGLIGNAIAPGIGGALLGTLARTAVGAATAPGETAGAKGDGAGQPSGIAGPPGGEGGGAGTSAQGEGGGPAGSAGTNAPGAESSAVGAQAGGFGAPAGGAGASGGSGGTGGTGRGGGAAGGGTGGGAAPGGGVNATGMTAEQAQEFGDRLGMSPADVMSMTQEQLDAAVDEAIGPAAVRGQDPQDIEAPPTTQYIDVTPREDRISTFMGIPMEDFASVRAMAAPATLAMAPPAAPPPTVALAPPPAEAPPPAKDFGAAPPDSFQAENTDFGGPSKDSTFGDVSPDNPADSGGMGGSTSENTSPGGESKSDTGGYGNPGEGLGEGMTGGFGGGYGDGGDGGGSKGDFGGDDGSGDGSAGGSSSESSGGNGGADGGGKGDSWRHGGPIPMDGNGISEPVPMTAHEGEFIMRPEAVQALGPQFLAMLNQMGGGPATLANTGGMGTTDVSAPPEPSFGGQPPAIDVRGGDMGLMGPPSIGAPATLAMTSMGGSGAEADGAEPEYWEQEHAMAEAERADRPYGDVASMGDPFSPGAEADLPGGAVTPQAAQDRLASMPPEMQQATLATLAADPMVASALLHILGPAFAPMLRKGMPARPMMPPATLGAMGGPIGGTPPGGGLAGVVAGGGPRGLR
jgi:hypothetical protein